MASMQAETWLIRGVLSAWRAREETHRWRGTGAHARQKKRQTATTTHEGLHTHADTRIDKAKMAHVEEKHEKDGNASVRALEKHTQSEKHAKQKRNTAKTKLVVTHGAKRPARHTRGGTREGVFVR